jgi:hypothetical protein
MDVVERVIPDPTELALSPHEAQGIVELCVVAAAADGAVTGAVRKQLAYIIGRVRSLVRSAMPSAHATSADQAVTPEGPYRSAAMPVDARVRHVPLPPGGLDLLLDEVSQVGWRDRMWTVSESLDREIVRKLAFQLSVVLVLRDVHTSDGELELIKKLRSALRIERVEADALMATVAMAPGRS